MSKKKDKYLEREAQKYEHPIPSREFILEHLTERGRPATLKQLFSEIKLAPGDEQEAFRRRLKAMVRDGQLHKNRRGTYGLVEKMELISGRVIGHKDGFGFLAPDKGDDDLFLSARQMRYVFHGDKVLARITGLDHRGRAEGMIVEVLEHNTQQLVGRYVVENGISYVKPVNPRITQEILISPTDVDGALHEQMVVVAITTQPSHEFRAAGKVVEVLGDHMAPGMEIEVAIRNHDIPDEWPEAVLDEAARFPAEVPEDAKKGRTDFRNLPFVTIDGEDAKDFDDAVYGVRDGKGFKLYVAIADVSHYVKPGSALDIEAYNRGNSVYFPERVIPMLPETLSNGLCSLKPKVDRLTMVCEMWLNPKGNITNYQFHEAVIHSHARLTYNKVHAMIEKNDEALRKEYENLIPPLETLYEIFHILRKGREERGSIDFDMPETKIIFGEARKIEKIVPLVRNNAHKLIEECMLCANICAAKYLLKNEVHTLFRVHEGPNENKLEDLRKFLGEHGLRMPGKHVPSPSDYATLLASIADRPDAHLIQMVLLRSLSQAVYSPENKGHFGLAFEAYAHFTSPIRRYPDLLVHRHIRSVLHDDAKQEGSFTKLEAQGEHTSMTERRADEATREVIDWLKCEFMMDKVGQEFEGVIGGVTGFGFFVELKNIYVEGLIHISTLPNDYYQYDLNKQALIGERSGRRFSLGDVVLVKVARVDLDQRLIDFILAETNSADHLSRKKAKSSVKAKKRRS